MEIGYCQYGLARLCQLDRSIFRSPRLLFRFARIRALTGAAYYPTISNLNSFEFVNRNMDCDITNSCGENYATGMTEMCRYKGAYRGARIFNSLFLFNKFPHPIGKNPQKLATIRLRTGRFLPIILFFLVPGCSTA